MAAKVQEFKLQIMHVLVDRTLAFGTGTRRNCLFSSEAFNALKSIIIPRGRSPPSAEAGANLKHLATSGTRTLFKKNFAARG